MTVGQRAPTNPIDQFIAHIVELQQRVGDLERSLSGDATAWTAPTLLNSWADYGAGWQPCQYRRVGDRIELRGLIANGTVGPGVPAFILPEGWRPPLPTVFAVNAADAHGRVDVYVDGGVAVNAGGNAHVSLSGIWFSTSV